MIADFSTPVCFMFFTLQPGNNLALEIRDLYLRGATQKSGILQLLKRELQFVFFQVFMTQIELNFR